MASFGTVADATSIVAGGDAQRRTPARADVDQKKRPAEIAQRTPVTLTLKKSMPITTMIG